MKRILSLALILGVLVTLFAGCQTGQTGTGGSSGYKILDEDFGEEDYSIAFRKADVALAAEVQAKLDEMVEDGTAAKISNTWFGADIYNAAGESYTDLSNISADDKSLETVKTKGKLVLGLDENFPPMGFRDENGKIVGFDIDLATEVAKRMGVELVLQPIDWAAKEMELGTGNIDMIWNGMSVLPDRIEKMLLIKPYIANTQVIIVPEGSAIKTKADLKGKKLALQTGSTALDALNADRIAAEVGQVVEFADNLSAFLDLKAGRVDAFVVDIVAGRYIIETNK